MSERRTANSTTAVMEQRAPREMMPDEAAPPWEPLKLGKSSGLYDVPWPWWDLGEDGRDR